MLLRQVLSQLMNLDMDWDFVILVKENLLMVLKYFYGETELFKLLMFMKGKT